MRGTALRIGIGGLVGLLSGGCSFDVAAGGGGGGGDQAGGIDGGADPAADGSPAVSDAAPPDAAAPSTALVTCGPTVVPPALDGMPMGPWAEVDLIRFEARQAEQVADLNAKYSFDAEVSFGCLHDGENLYLYAEVADGDVVSNSMSFREDDGIVVFLDGSGDRAGTYGEDDHALFIGADATTWDYGPGELSPSGVVLETDTGYQVEIAIDKAGIASPLPADFGFNLAIIDDDGMGNPNRDVFALRHVPAPPACESCCDGQPQPWCDTSVMGSVQLVSR